MMIRKQAGAMVLGVVAVVLMGWLPLVAQEPAKTNPAPPAQKKQIRRVPDYFGQIGLTPEQKSNIYVVVNRRQEKIEALEKQVVSERAEMIGECEGLLNDTQKKLLDNLRKAASEPRPAATTKPAGAPKPAEPPKGAN